MGLETLILSFVMGIGAPYITKALAYVLPPEWVRSMANGIQCAAETKAGLSSRKG